MSSFSLKSGELRKFLGKKKRDLNASMAIPGSMNLAAKHGSITVEAMKILQVSAGAFARHVVRIRCVAMFIFSSSHFRAAIRCLQASGHSVCLPSC
jgi:hypothetical protein